MTSGYLSSRSRIFSDIREGLNWGTSAGEREGRLHMGLGPDSPAAGSLLYQHLSGHGHSVLSPPCLGHCFKLHLPGKGQAWPLLLEWNLSAHKALVLTVMTLGR